MSEGATPVSFDSATEGYFLALETASREGSLALGRRTEPAGDVEIIADTVLRAEEEHAALLFPRSKALLEASGLVVKDLTGVVVGAGPGSFTGVRVAAATAKGLAWSLQLPLWAFSSLAGAAASVEGETVRPRLVLFDARGDRLYAAAYRFSKGRVETLLPPRATTVGELLDGLVPPGAVLLGDGAFRHRALLEGAGHAILPPPAGEPTARGLLRLLALDGNVGPVADPGRWEPDYLRESGAERMWKTRRKGWRP